MQRYKKSMTLAIKSLGLLKLICDYPYIISVNIFRQQY